EQFRLLSPEKWGALEDDLLNVHNLGDELSSKIDNGTYGDLKKVVTFSFNIVRYLFYRKQIKRNTWITMGLKTAQALQTQDVETEFYRHREALFLCELGNMTGDTDVDDKGLAYLETSRRIYHELIDESGEAMALIGIGNKYLLTKKIEKAMEAFEQALLL